MNLLRVRAKRVGGPAMPCKLEIILFLYVVTVYFYTFQVCHSVNLRQRDNDFSTSWKGIKQDHDNQVNQVNQAIRGANVRASSQRRLTKVRRDSDAYSEEPPSYFNVPKRYETGSSFAPKVLPWAAGNVKVGRRSSAPGSEDGHETDFIG